MTTETITPKRDMRFYHSRQITNDRQPMLCEVTRVTTTSVYFRNTTGYKSVVNRDRFIEVVGSLAD